MVRGFTLLELLITLAVLAVVLTFAAPSFERFSQQNQMQTLASELQGFLLQAKSEAVFRNQDLWAHFVMDSNPSASGQWTIVLKDSDSPSSGNTILLLSGRDFATSVWNRTSAPTKSSSMVCAVKWLTAASHFIRSPRQAKNSNYGRHTAQIE